MGAMMWSWQRQGPQAERPWHENTCNGILWPRATTATRLSPLNAVVWCNWDAVIASRASQVALAPPTPPPPTPPLWRLGPPNCLSRVVRSGYMLRALASYRILLAARVCMCRWTECAFSHLQAPQCRSPNPNRLLVQPLPSLPYTYNKKKGFFSSVVQAEQHWSLYLTI